MRSTKLGLAALLIASILPAARPARAVSEEAPVTLSIFECYMRLPAGLTINTGETTHLALYSRSSDEPLRLTVGRYQEPIDRSLVQEDSWRDGDLVVERLRSRNSSRVLFRVHDRSQELVLSAATRTFLEEVLEGLLSSCRADPHVVLELEQPQAP